MSLKGRRRVRAFSTILWQSIMESIFYFPVLLIAAVYLLPASAVWGWIGFIPICYWAGSAILSIRPSLYLIHRLLLAALVGGIYSWLSMEIWVGELQIVPTVGCGLLSAFAAFKGMTNVLKGWTESFKNSQIQFCILFYIVLQPLKLFMFKLIDYNDFLIIGGIASVIIFFFLANERHMNYETIDTSQSKTSLAFKRQNRLMMMIMIALVSLLALFKQIQRTVEQLFKVIIDKIMSWLNRPPKETVTKEPPAVDSPVQLPTGVEDDPAAWIVFLEQLLKVIGILIALIAIAFMLFFVVRKLIQVVKQIIAKLMMRGTENRQGDSGFTDEVEQLMSLNQLRKQMNNQLKKLLPKKRKPESEWDDAASNAEKVRFLYGQLIRLAVKRGYVLQRNLSPRETAADLVKHKSEGAAEEKLSGLVDAYEQVRYGERKTSDSQVAALKQQFYKQKQKK